MGKFAIKPIVKLLAWTIAMILIYLNFRMLISQSIPVFENQSFWPKFWIIVGGIFFAALLLYITIEPFWSKRKVKKSILMHPEIEELVINVPRYNKIAIALDFTQNDEKLISYSIGQGNKDTELFLVHVVESASANLWGNQSFDYETRKDQDKLDDYVEQLTNKGFTVSGKLGFMNRAKEIVRLTEESNADILVMGSHGHRGLKDLLFGQTANTVRHKIKIPVFMVRV
jgi:manganese transport protein